MLALELAAMWLSGRWIPTGYSPLPGVTSPGDLMVDIFGNTITVGSMVALCGTVTALEPSNAHFQDVTFVPQFPQSLNVFNTQGVNPQQQMIASVKCHPLQLIAVKKYFPA